MSTMNKDGAALAGNTTQTIRQELRSLGQAFRARHPWIERHQSAIGLSIFVASIAGTVAMGVAYAKGALPAVVTIPVTAFFLSLLHELEHDLIHNLYFPGSKLIQDIMMGGVWLLRPSTINPWVRKRLHLHHHKFSGTETDLEEQAITNGETWGLRRFLMTADSMLAIVLRPKAMRQTATAFAQTQYPSSPRDVRRLVLQNVFGYFPLGIAHYGFWYAFLAVTAYATVAKLSGHPWVPTGDMAQAVDVINLAAVVLVIPNVIRSFCLHLVSSNMHYFGDVERGNVVEQTQVWTAAWTWPLQAFCFGFGSTHAIHHFVVNDPFYVRQAIMSDAHRVLRANGVRFNDFGTFFRANRFHVEAEEARVEGAELPIAA